MKRYTNPRRVPVWMTALIIVSMLPATSFPVLLSVSTSGILENRLLLWLYPVYVVTAGFLAWQCYGRRTEMTWILIILLWLSHAAIWMLACGGPTCG